MMNPPLLSLLLRADRDVVVARQRARQIAALVGIDGPAQTRLAAAVSEVARHVVEGGGGRVVYLLDDPLAPRMLLVRITGRAVVTSLSGGDDQAAEAHAWLAGASRLVDRFEVATEPNDGATITLGKRLARRFGATSPIDREALTLALTREAPTDAYEEVQQQNQELLQALDELRARQEELARVNQELEDTNRGVVALFAELDDKADSLRRENKVKTRFLSEMTHEFRTPLNAIISLTKLLRDHADGDLTDEQETQVAFIEKAARDLSDLVNDLLDLARAEAGKMVVRPSEFTAVDLFAALRGLLRPLLANNSRVTLHFDEPTDIPPLDTDEAKVSQVLRNFISNALKFTDAGEVRVSARYSAEENRVLFAVSDTGIGIAPEDQERIFEEFSQIDNPVQQRVKGTGLGLPLSRRLATLLGGTVSVRSVPGAGSTFTLSIPPCAPGAEAVVARPQAVSQDNRPAVLVVEDSPDSLFLYERYLSEADARMVAARTVRAARAALQAQRPPAIVLDILLDGEHTWDLLTDLKADPATRAVPVLVATVVDNQRKALAAGADHFLVKPIDRAALLDWLAPILAAHRPPMESLSHA